MGSSFNKEMQAENNRRLIEANSFSTFTSLNGKKSVTELSLVSLSTHLLHPSEFKWPVSLLCEHILRVTRQDVGTVRTVCLLADRYVSAL